MFDRVNAVIARYARWHDAAAILVFVIAVTLWFSDVLFGGLSFYARDIFQYHFPMKRIVREAMLSGEWPMWSPLTGAGQPMAANPAYEVFYPPQLLILLPDIHLGLNLHVVVHFYLCGIGLFYLLRSFGAGAAASLLGAIGYTLGGPYLSLARTLPFLFSMAWVPLIFLFVRRYLLYGSRRDLLTGAIFGGMQALVAEPTTMLQTWMIIGAYVAYRVMGMPPGQRGKVAQRMIAGVLITGVISAAIAAAQLVPMLDFVRESVRSEPLNWDIMIAKWSLVPARILELFYPLVFQSLIDFNGNQWITTMHSLGEPFVSSFYPGFALGIFFVAGFVAWRRGSGLVLAICSVLFILAIGSHTPLLRFLYDIGIFTTIRFPEKFAMGASLVVVIWAALTADLFFRGDSRVRGAVLYVTAGWFVLAFFLILAAASVWQMFWVVTFARGVVLLFILYAIRRWPTPLWAALLIVITILDVVHLRNINPTITRDYFEPPSVTRQLDGRKDQYRIFHYAEWEWMGEFPNAAAYFKHPLGRWWALRNALMTRNAGWWGFQYVLDRDYDLTLLKTTERFNFAMIEMFRSRQSGWEERMMAMSNAWYRGRFRPAAEEIRRVGARWEEVIPIDFQPAREQYPRFYFADEIVQIADVHDFVARVLAGESSPRAAFVQWPSFTPAAGSVRSASQTMRTMRIEAEAQGRSLLMISVTPHRYWRARVNGQRVEPRVVNIGYQAIELPAGRHVVEMEYWNPLVVPSMILSVLALLGAIVGAALSQAAVPPAAETQPPVVVPAPKQNKRKRRR